MDAAQLEDLAARFASGTLSREEWTHAAHLAVGAWHVDRYGADEAMRRLRTGIRALNERLGGKNTATSGYHETITSAYVQLITHARAEAGSDTSLPDFVLNLLESPLGQREALLRFWSREVLMSEAARRTWTAPDIRPLPRRPNSSDA